MKSKKAFSLIELSMVLAIIGILAGGALESSVLIYRTKLHIARANTENAPVLEMPDLYGWWEATSEQSFEETVQNASQIRVWRDINAQATHRIDLVQPVDENRPTYNQASLNGLPSIAFDGNDFLKAAIDPSVIFTNGSGSIFIVYTPLNTLTKNYVVSQPVGNCTKNIEIGNAVNFLAGSFGINAGCGFATSSRVGTLSGGFPSLISFSALPSPLTPGLTDNIEIYKNGYPLALITEGAGGYNGAINGAYGAGTAPLIIGARDVQNIGKFDSYFSGKVGEIIIFNRAVRNDERKLIEKYLAKKWSLDINLASYY